MADIIRSYDRTGLGPLAIYGWVLGPGAELSKLSVCGIRPLGFKDSAPPALSSIQNSRNRIDWLRLKCISAE